MSDFLNSILTLDTGILAFAALLAGCVRGFSGFGTALIYVPLAGTVLDPVPAVATLILMDLVGPIPVIPKVWPHAHRGDLTRLLLGVLLALPVGLAALSVLDSSVFRTLVSIISLSMLTGLVLGWRYSGFLGPRAVFGTGATAGFLGGVAGIPGPPVIFVYMASTHPPQVIRANTTLFLLGYDWLAVAMMAAVGWLEPAVLLTGLALTIPNMIGNLAGAALFVPERESAYRAVAYALMFGAAVIGFPFW